MYPLEKIKEPLYNKIYTIFNLYIFWKMIRDYNSQKKIDRNHSLDTIYISIQEKWVLELIKLFDNFNSNTENKTIGIFEIKGNIEEIILDKVKKGEDCSDLISKLKKIEIILNKENIKIKKIKKNRNKYYCHNDFETIITNKEKLKKNNLNFDELFELIKSSKEIYEIIFKEPIGFVYLESSIKKSFEQTFNLNVRKD